jgi:hypothetical protein
MADLGLIESELRALPTDVQPTFLRIFRAILPDLRFGHPTGDTKDPSENFGAGFFAVTTPGVANTEFTIPHGFGRTPYLVVPVLPLDQVNAQIVPLKVTRVADDKRVYLSSSVVNATITVFVEG